MTQDEQSDKVFRALASATRRRLLDRLRDGPRTTGELCAAFGDLDRCTVMQHLWVIVVRQGRQRWNHLNVLPIKHIHDRWIGPYAAHAVEFLDRLDAATTGR
jgi:hypothetical protein